MFIPKQRVEELIDEMLNEINKDYYRASRKTIFDYVLKDNDQKKRLGIEYNPQPTDEYGERLFCGLEPSEE